MSDKPEIDNRKRREQERLAAALRVNLKRRKAQANERAPVDEDAAKPALPAADSAVEIPR